MKENPKKRQKKNLKKNETICSKIKATRNTLVVLLKNEKKKKQIENGVMNKCNKYNKNNTTQHKTKKKK